jgi:cysteinyl-tRNA synthetase
MILEYLGEDFDLHSGGVDLIFPHHENEIAQSCCSTHGQFAHHWMHVAHLMVDGGKMSKSLGNLYTLSDLRQRGYTAAEVRYVLISGHYRAPLNFTFHSLDSARQALQKLAKADKAMSSLASNITPSSPGPFQDAWETLLNDLNVPGALGGIFGLLNKIKPTAISAEEATTARNGLHFMLKALGILLPPVQEEAATDVPEDIQSLAQQRWNAKQAKDWATADSLRKQLEDAGWLIKDSKEGFTVIPKA